MSEQSSATLKGFFETADIPTQQQFADFIESYENAIDTGQQLGLETGITAIAPPAQGTGTVVTKRYNHVSTGNANGAGVVLLPAVANKILTVFNLTGNPLFVFPLNGDKFQGYASDKAMELQAGEVAEFTAIDGVTWNIDMMGTQVRTAVETLTIEGTTTDPTKATVPDIDEMSCIKTDKAKVLSFGLNYGKDGAQTGAAIGSGQYLFTIPDNQKFVPGPLGFYSGTGDGKNFNIGNYAVAETGSFAGGSTGQSVFLIIPFDATRFRLISQSLTQNGEYINNVNWDLLQPDLYYCFTFKAEVEPKF